MTAFEDIDDVAACLAAVGYIADRELATTVYLAQALENPLLLEGEAGVGKTELAKALAAARGARLIRLQCYEGIDASQALYEWNYPRQLLHIRLAERSTDGSAPGSNREALERELFSEPFLVHRPLLDEVDRADEEFEAFLLEVLSDFQITVPELGTLSARQRPLVALHREALDEATVAETVGCIFKYQDDIDRFRSENLVAVLDQVDINRAL